VYFSFLLKSSKTKQNQSPLTSSTLKNQNPCFFFSCFQFFEIFFFLRRSSKVKKEMRSMGEKNISDNRYSVLLFSYLKNLGFVVLFFPS